MGKHGSQSSPVADRFGLDLVWSYNTVVLPDCQAGERAAPYCSCSYPSDDVASYPSHEWITNGSRFRPKPFFPLAETSSVAPPIEAFTIAEPPERKTNSTRTLLQLNSCIRTRTYTRTPVANTTPAPRSARALAIALHAPRVPHQRYCAFQSRYLSPIVSILNTSQYLSAVQLASSSSAQSRGEEVLGVGTYIQSSGAPNISVDVRAT